MKIADPARCFIALDGDVSQSRQLIETYAPQGLGMEIGRKQIMSGHMHHLIQIVFEKGTGQNPIFIDDKDFDIGMQVGGAVASVAALFRGVTNPGYMTIANMGLSETLREAVNHKGCIKLLGVGVLTTQDKDELYETFVPNMLRQRTPRITSEIYLKYLVQKLAALSTKCGLDGIICAGEHQQLLANNPATTSLLRVVPGIRHEVKTDDQQRVTDARKAFEDGAHGIIIGRELSQAKDPHRVIGDLLDYMNTD